MRMKYGRKKDQSCLLLSDPSFICKEPRRMTSWIAIAGKGSGVRIVEDPETVSYHGARRYPRNAELIK